VAHFDNFFVWQRLLQGLINSLPVNYSAVAAVLSHNTPLPEHMFIY